MCGFKFWNRLFSIPVSSPHYTQVTLTSAALKTNMHAIAAGMRKQDQEFVLERPTSGKSNAAENM